MGYCTASHVSALDQGRDPFTASSKPTSGDVDLFIARTAGEIDGALSLNGYDTPVPTTATAAHAMLEGYNALGGDALVQRAAVNSDRAKVAWDAWQNCLTLLKTIDLPDLERGGGPETRRARYQGGSTYFGDIDDQ